MSRNFVLPIFTTMSTAAPPLDCDKAPPEGLEKSIVKERCLRVDSADVDPAPLKLAVAEIWRFADDPSEASDALNDAGLLLGELPPPQAESANADTTVPTRSARFI